MRYGRKMLRATLRSARFRQRASEQKINSLKRNLFYQRMRSTTPRLITTKRAIVILDMPSHAVVTAVVDSVELARKVIGGEKQAGLHGATNAPIRVRIKYYWALVASLFFSYLDSWSFSTLRKAADEP